MFYVEWGYTKRKAVKLVLLTSDKIKPQYLIDVQAVVEMEDIPPSFSDKLRLYSH